MPGIMDEKDSYVRDDGEIEKDGSDVYKPEYAGDDVFPLVACCSGVSGVLGRTCPCFYDAFLSVVGWPKMPGIKVGMDQKDSCVDEEAHVLTMKYPIEHADNDSGMYKAEFAGNDAIDVVLPSIVGGYNMPGIMFGMELHESSYGSSWLSNELQVDPIMDEPMEMTAGGTCELVLCAKDDTLKFPGMAGFSVSACHP